MDATHDYRKLLLKLALGLLLLAGLPFAAASAQAGASEDDQTIACNVTCANGSCSASGEGATCTCYNGNPHCTDGGGGSKCSSEWLLIIWEDGSWEYSEWEECEGTEMN